MDILRAVTSPNLDIRRKTLDIVLDLITLRNIDEVRVYRVVCHVVYGVVSRACVTCVCCLCGMCACVCAVCAACARVPHVRCVCAWLTPHRLSRLTERPN